MSLAYTPHYWRQRAEEARARAEQMTDETARRGMLAIAEGYERMAEHALARLEADSAGRDGSTKSA